MVVLPGQDKQVTAGAFEAIQRSLDGVARAEDKLPASSHLVAAVCDRLIVLSDLEPSPRGPYGWSPMSLDRGKAGGTLDSWLTLPWQGPAEVVLPGFHTAAETGLKRGANGDEIFFAACGLMASGSRSILLSRWPTAGQSAFDLVREYVQELPFVPAAEAWQRSVQLLRDNPIAPELEPRLSSAGAAVELTAAPPFFWAGYMLVDLGRAPPAAPRAAPPPAAKPVPSDDPPEDAAPPAAAPGKKPKRD